MFKNLRLIPEEGRDDSHTIQTRIQHTRHNVFFNILHKI